ncbi:MAG: exodeoxyribonuclease VII large subunit [Lachnospiraceae bacterium]|nr:exodeoxyribonuclease VII large subunit [Lachnospiraceae bacterium]MBQ2407140.1 exodeoxyribonuclease VII large subunit [Lachnospiraceae bacterium]MEE0919668.1 exodeoxyribonuclease VII large subunit [Lachnospiraceae bacterium]
MHNVYTVAQVNSYIKNMFTQDFMLRSIMVKGEVSNCKYHSSGHIYFTLKDSKGIISCVMFAGNRGGLSFKLEEGQMVVVGGTIDVYERDGKYQLYARQIILDGVGLLYERFEKLKRELSDMGMFASEYKKPIPKYISRLGVVTADTGAAVRDIINIATRRNPYVQIILYPAIVQGEQAVESIVNGIHALENLGVDVMIVGRGGGSIEDLWAFNEEAVAQAVFDCSVPVISAVGHETDTTIIDFVADMRAPTPSAAAELAVYDIVQLMEKLEIYRGTLDFAMDRNLRKQKNELLNYSTRIKYLSPLNQIREKRTYCMEIEEKLNNSINSKVKSDKHRLALYVEKLKGLSPLEKLNQGYSFTEKEDGTVVNDVSRVKEGDMLKVYVRNGLIEAKVTDISIYEE